MKQRRYLKMAQKASEKSDHHSHKIGCVITRGNDILGVGFNLSKTHPRSPHKFKSIHAEFMASINAGYDIKGATVYVFRQHKNGDWAMSRPCPYCWKFLMDMGVKDVVYSFEGSFVQEQIA